MRITKHFTFEASHILPKHKGKCSRLHGHSWKLAITVDGPIDGTSEFVMDYGVLKLLVNEHVIEHLDHSHLGQDVALAGSESRRYWPYFGDSFYPSSENLCRAIFKILSPLIQETPNVRLYEVVIAETCTSEARWGADDEHRSVAALGDRAGSKTGQSPVSD